MIDLRHAILGTEDLPRVPVATPEWPAVDGHLYVRMLSAAERVAFGLSLGDDPPKLENHWARFAVLCLCDEQGQRVFADADAEALGKKSAAVLLRIKEAAETLNLTGREAAEDVRKNSEATPA